MKRILIAVVVAMLAIAGTAFGYTTERDYELIIFDQALRIAELETEATERGVQVATLQADLSAAEDLAKLVTNADNLRAQIAGMYQQISSVSGQLSSSRAELARVINAVRNFTAMSQSVTVAMGTVSCQFPRGTSMVPTIRSTDMVCSTRAAAYVANVKVGDIVIAPLCCSTSLNGRHRIYSEVEGGWILKGDAYSSPDPCITPKGDVLGVTLFVVRDARW